jgi:hypothetical protein
VSFAVLGAMLCIAFAVCAWSGRTLARHYQDPLEVAAVLAVAVCVLAALVVANRVHEADELWPESVLGVAMTLGLFAGYLRSGPLR